MNEVQEKKYWFVRNDLLHLLQAIDRDILSAEYQVIGCEEYVQVDWLFSGSGQRYHKNICVSADSLKALAHDVIRCI